MKQWALCFTSIFFNGDQPNQIVKHNITHVTKTFWKNGGDCDIEIGDFLKLGGLGDGVLLGSLCFVFQEHSNVFLDSCDEENSGKVVHHHLPTLEVNAFFFYYFLESRS